MFKRLVSSALCVAVVLSTAVSAMAADKLQVVTTYGGADPAAKPFAALVKSFENSTKITVENSSAQSSNEWKASVVTSFNTGDEPHVLQFFNGADAKDIVDKVVSVAEIRAVYPQYAKDISSSSLKSMAESNGVTYAVPTVGFYESLFVNKDMFDNSKLAYPTNWANFTKAIKWFANNNSGGRVIPISVGFANEPHYLLENLILSASGAVDQQTRFGTDISKVPDGFVKGLDVLKTLGDMGAFGNLKAASTKTGEAARIEFYTKKSAMVVEGSWIGGKIAAAKRGNSVQVFPFPQVPGGKGTGNEVISGFSSGFYITKKAWNDPATREQAVKFVDYMTTKASVGKMIKDAYPTSAPAANIATGGGTLQSRSGAAVVGKADATVMPADSGPFVAAAWAEICTSAIKIANGEMTAAQVLAKAVPLNKY